MKRYIVRKYVMAESLVEALQKEKKVVAEDGWIDEKQPDEPTSKDQIGFDLQGRDSYISHSPYMKKRKKILTKKGKK
jgi:hypothetical protein